MNKYKPSHYIGDEKTRYILGQIGDNNVLFIGVNPSTANDIKSDTTISKIINFTKINNYSGWFIANIYPQRTTDPKNLDIFPDEILLKKNIKNIKEFVGIH